MADHITPHLTWRSESAVRVSTSAPPPSLGWYPREHLITGAVSVRCALTAVKPWDWLKHLQYLNWYSMMLATSGSRVQFPGKMWIKMITFKMHCIHIISCFQYSLQCVISHAQSIAWAHIHSLLCFTKLVKLVLCKNPFLAVHCFCVVRGLYYSNKCTFGLDYFTIRSQRLIFISQPKTPSVY